MCLRGCAALKRETLRAMAFSEAVTVHGSLVKILPAQASIQLEKIACPVPPISLTLKNGWTV